MAGRYCLWDCEILVARLFNHVISYHSCVHQWIVAAVEVNKVALLGEYYESRHDGELVQRLIPVGCTAGRY